MGIAPGLDLYAFEGAALFFRFDHATGFAVYIQQVVGNAVAWVEREFSDSHTLGGMDVDRLQVLYLPAC